MMSRCRRKDCCSWGEEQSRWREQKLVGVNWRSPYSGGVYLPRGISSQFLAAQMLADGLESMAAVKVVLVVRRDSKWRRDIHIDSIGGLLL